MNTVTIKKLSQSMIGTLLLLSGLVLPNLAIAGEHGHNHNHFNPALESLGNDIISLTVCYKNGYLSDQDQEPAFQNLIAHAGVDGEELGMYYMSDLGPKAEEIMADEHSRILWTEDFCSELTITYLDSEKLKQQKAHKSEHHGHRHDHEQQHDEDILSADIIEQDIERGRLLSIN